MKTSKPASLLKTAAILVILLVSVACQSKQVESKETTIKVLYSSVSAFKQDYGQYLDFTFPHITFDIIEFEPVFGQAMWNGMQYLPTTEDGWNNEAFIRLVEDNQPDILFFPPSLASHLVDQAVLLDVTDQLTSRELNNMDASLQDYFLQLGQTKLYFLSNSYAPQVLLYNKDVIEHYNLEMDASGWDKLAIISATIQQLSSSETTGFASKWYDGAELLLNIGRDAGLSWYDDLNQQVLLDQPNWSTTLQTFLRLSAGEPYEGEQSIFQQFEEGQVAMLLTDYSSVDKLANNKNITFQWDIAPPPAAIDGSTYHHGFQLYNGVSSSTKQVEAARSIWLYLNSETLAKQRFNSSFSRMEIPMYSNSFRNKDYNTDALYTVAVHSLHTEHAMPTSSKLQEIKLYLNQQLYSMKQDEGIGTTDELNTEDLKQLLLTWKKELDYIINTQ